MAKIGNLFLEARIVKTTPVGTLLAAMGLVHTLKHPTNKIIDLKGSSGLFEMGWATVSKRGDYEYIKKKPN